MSDTLTDEHLSWTQDFTGVALDTRRQPEGADAMADDTQPGVADGEQSLLPADTAEEQVTQEVDPSTDEQPQPVDTGVDRPGQSAGPDAEQAAQSADAGAAPGGILDSIGDAVGAVGGAVVGAAEAVGGAVEGAAKAVGGAVEGAAEAVGGAVEGAAKAVGGTLEDAAVAVGRAVGVLDPPQPPKSITPPILGPTQQKRADDAKAKLSPADQKKYQDLLDAAKSDKEKQYLAKGLSAGHSIAELQAFEAKIAGKDAKWMQDNLSLTGNSQGKGVKQQWSMSCNATTAEAVRGEMDPLYALKMHEDNPDITARNDADPTKLNPNLAADQKAQLESAYPDGKSGGLARPVGDHSKVPGRWNTDLLNKDKDSTGVNYTNKKIGAGGLTVDQAVDDISADVQKGMPVPIVIGDGGQAAYAHYVLVTATDPGPPRSFSIHDPANGTTEVRTEDELKNGKIDLAGDPTKKGSGWNKLGAYEKPTPVAVK
jgi:hypothetical protein